MVNLRSGKNPLFIWITTEGTEFVESRDFLIRFGIRDAFTELQRIGLVRCELLRSLCSSVTSVVD